MADALAAGGAAKPLVEETSVTSMSSTIGLPEVLVRSCILVVLFQKAKQLVLPSNKSGGLS